MDDTPATDDAPAALPDSPDRRAELSAFLRTRRARLKPEDVGISSHGRHRRVPGLRREELAQLAGVSVAYYTRLEQGNGRNVSAEVLYAIARALHLTDAEHAHLTHLAKPKQQRRKYRVPKQQQVRVALRQLLDSMEGMPAYVSGARSEILAWNRMAAALFGDWGKLPPAERNWARLTFLSPTTASCSSTGTPRRPTSSAICGCTRARTRRTRTCRRSSVNSPSRARSSGGCGPLTM